MANSIIQALLSGQKFKQNKQTLALNEQKISQQGRTQQIQSNVQHLLNMKNMLDSGATDQEILGNIQQTMDSGQGDEHLADAGNILKTQGRGGFEADVEKGLDNARTFQQSGIVDLPGLDQRPQSSTSVPGGTVIVGQQGQVGFTADTDAQKLATKEARLAKSEAEFTSKSNIEQRKANIEVEKTQQKDLNKRRGVIRDKFNSNRNKASASISRSKQLLKKLSSITTGSFAEQKVKLKRVFGIDVSKPEAFIAAINQQVLADLVFISGAVSDKDLELVRQTKARLSNSTTGNIQIVREMIQLMEHTVGVSNKFKSFIKKGGKPEEFEEPDFLIGKSGQKATSPEEKNARKQLLLERIRKGRSSNGS